MNSEDMAGRIMAHAFNDELEKISSSRAGLKKSLLARFSKDPKKRAAYKRALGVDAEKDLSVFFKSLGDPLEGGGAVKPSAALRYAASDIGRRLGGYRGQPQKIRAAQEFMENTSKMLQKYGPQK